MGNMKVNSSAPVFPASARSVTSLRKQQEAVPSGSRLSVCECGGVSFIHFFKKLKSLPNVMNVKTLTPGCQSVRVL